MIQSRLGATCRIKLARDVDGKLVGARQRLRVSLEVVDRELQDFLELLQFELAACEFRRVKRSFVVVAQKMLDSRGLRPEVAAVSRCLGRITRAPKPGPYDRWLLSPIRLKPLLGATTQASEDGRFRSLRKYSKTVGDCGGTAAKLLKVS